MQQTFLAFWQNRAQLDPHRPIPPLLFTIARRTLIDAWRKQAVTNQFREYVARLPLIKGKDVKSQTIKVPKDYFIYGKLRPYLNKYWYNNTDTKNIVCSSEFFVFNCLETIAPDYYKIILSSEIVQKQIQKEMSGARMPRISEETFKSLLIPLPDRKSQKEIVTKCYNFRNNIDSNLLRAERLNVDAQNEFQSAIFNID